MATPGKTKMLLKYKSVDKHVKLSCTHQCKQGNVTSSTSILFSSLVCTLPKKPTIPWLSHHYTLTALGCRDGAVGVQGWRSGESTRLPPMWPGFDSQIRRQMWVEFVGSLLCTERFSPGTSVSPLPKNQNLNLT